MLNNIINTGAKHRLQKEANMSVWGKRSSGGASDGHTHTAGSAWLNWTDWFRDWNSFGIMFFNPHQMIVKIVSLFASVWKILNMFVSIWSAQRSWLLLLFSKCLRQDIKFSLLQVCRNFSEAWPLVLISFYPVLFFKTTPHFKRLQNSKQCLSTGRPAGGSTELRCSSVRSSTQT